MEEYYYTITRTMVEDLGLKGNELLVYAILNMFSQMKGGSFYGSLATLREMAGITTNHTIITTLRSLQEKGLITRDDDTIPGRSSYSVIRDSAKIAQPKCKNCTQTSAKIAHKNNIENKNIEQEDAPRPFVPPTKEEIIAYCEKSGYRINVDKFLSYYETRGWVKKNGKTVKDWKATVRTWYEDDRRAGRPVPTILSVPPVIPFNPSRPSLDELMKQYN